MEAHVQSNRREQARASRAQQIYHARVSVASICRISVASLQINARGVYLAPGGGGSYGAPVSVIADPEHRKIRAAYSTAKTGTVVIVVWSVVPL